MSKGVNKVMIVGHVGQEPQVRHLPNGTSVTNVSVATNNYWLDSNGEKRESVEWHRIVFFGKLADVCGQYVSKGSQIYLEGRLQTREWEKDGIKRYTTEIIGREMQILSPRGSEENANNKYDQTANERSFPTNQQDKVNPPNSSAETSSGMTTNDDFDDDLPF